jgi:hypothetical protein
MKYQWIRVNVSRRTEWNDNRRESWRPDLDSIEILGPQVSSRDDWRERRLIIDSLPHHTVNELKELYDSERISLGIVRPTQILDVEIRPDTTHWKPNWAKLFPQILLFGEQQKPLEKLPFKFQYVFECSDSRKVYRAMIEDWELGTLFLRERERLSSDQAAANSVKAKYLDEMANQARDTRLFMGTRWPRNVWLVLGVFWPPKARVEQSEMF